MAIFDELLRDPLLRFRVVTAPEERLTVVDINEASIDSLGPWPWPRERLADLVEILLGPMGARAVALDMVLPEAENGDERLAALAAHAPLTMAIALDYVPRHPVLAQGVPSKGRTLMAHERGMRATGYIGNAPVFSDARCVGNIGFLPDADGAIRRLPGLSQLGDRGFPMLAEALLRCAGGASIHHVAGAVDNDGLWRIPYRRDWSAFTVLPAAMVLSEKVPIELVRGRLVIIGSSALGLSDRVTTPLAVSTSGVLVHAASLSAMLDGLGSADGPSRWWLMSGWLGLTFLAWMLAGPRLSPLAGVTFLVGGAMAWIGLATWQINWYLPLLPVLAAYAVLLMAGLSFEWWWVRRESARILRIFSHYVAPTVLDELIRQIDETPLKPHFREVTVLVADMEGYTKATASLGLEETASLTRDFLDCLTRPILAEEGTIDKYTGDGVVAFWNDPLPCVDHAERALRAARQIVAEVAALSDRRSAQGLNKVRVRIGVESGEAIVGDLGTRFRSTYTAVGNCINLASKLESAARDLEQDIVIGPNAFERLASHEGFDFVGKIFLGGMTLDCWTPKRGNHHHAHEAP